MSPSVLSVYPRCPNHRSAVNTLPHLAVSSHWYTPSVSASVHSGLNIDSVATASLLRQRWLVCFVLCVCACVCVCLFTHGQMLMLQLSSSEALNDKLLVTRTRHCHRRSEYHNNPVWSSSFYTDVVLERPSSSSSSSSFLACTARSAYSAISGT